MFMKITNKNLISYILEFEKEIKEEILKELLKDAEDEWTNRALSKENSLKTS